MTQPAKSNDSGAGQRRSWGLLNRWSLLVCLTVLVQAYCIRCGYSRTPRAYLNTYFEKPYLYKAWMPILEVMRYPSPCEATCGGMKNGQVDIETYGNLTKERFERVYAIPARPVIVRNATFHWLAMKHFNLSFFRDLYDKYAPDSYAPHDARSLFLPFRTPLKYTRLRKALHMDPEDQAKPWYIGWSNVDLNVHRELKKYYEVPNFLPDDTEHGQAEWFFMGTSQEAVWLHIDQSAKPSWHAQISGRKVWEMHPPAECYFQCSPVKAYLQEGDLYHGYQCLVPRHFRAPRRVQHDVRHGVCLIEREGVT